MTTRRLRALLTGLVVAPLAVALAAPASAASAVQRTWAGSQIHLYDAFAAGYSGKGVTVAVLDGWIDPTHPDYSARVVGSADCTSGTCSTRVVRDACGQNHGTHVAGTAVSSSYGVARGARLLAVKVLADDGSGDCAGDPADVAAGIRWAVAHGADVLNLSLGPDVPGSSSSGPIPTAVREAARAGAVVVFSAGNANLPVAQSYDDDALVVAATGPGGALASYSQHGSGVSVAAPGGQPTGSDQCSPETCITSTYPDAQYAVAAGTSMAAPHVAGLAALLREAHPSWTRQQVEDRIRATAVPLSGAGSGRVDAKAALGIRNRTASSAPTRKAAPPRRTQPRAATTQAPVTIAAPPSASAPAAPLTAAPRPLATRDPAPAAAVPQPVTTAEAPATRPTRRDVIPIPLAAVAGALVGLAATALVVLGPRPR